MSISPAQLGLEHLEWLWVARVKKADSRGDITGALSEILSDPPYGDGVDEAKVSFFSSSYC